MVNSPFLELLKNRINLSSIPFSERGSRLLILQSNQHFSIRLAERWFKRDGQLSGYRNRPPIVDDWRFTDGDGTPLEFTITTYPHRIDCDTSIGRFTIVYADIETLLITLPAAKCGMRFRANLDQVQTDRRGGVLRLTGDIRRHIAYTTNAHLLHIETQAHEDAQFIQLAFEATGGQKSLLLNITPRLGFNRWIPDVATTLEAAARRWHDWFAAAPPVLPQFQAQYYYAWWVMRAGLISTRFYTTREAMTPSKIHYVGVWQWDAYFHALAYRHVDMKLAKDQLRVILDHQREDGMIPDAVHDEGAVTHLTFPVDADVTKPPLLAWSAWKLYETEHDREFLDEIYEPMVRWNTWWFEKNDLDGNGLCEYQHPYSSGLDDNPLWDDGMPVESPDLNTYLCLQQDSLANIAEVLGEREDAAMWRERAKAMAQRMIRLMWDEEAGLFWASHKGARINVRTPFNLFPLITGQMPKEIAARLIAHLTDEKQFWTHYPVPTVAIDDPKFNALQMWRGPSWVNVNYLLIDGLERAGYRDLADELRRRTLEMILSGNDIYEYYEPRTGKAPPKAASIYGWSSALFIEMVIQESQRL